MRRLQVLSGEKYQEDKALQNITIIFRKTSGDVNQKRGQCSPDPNLTVLGEGVCPHASLRWCLPQSLHLIFKFMFKGVRVCFHL